MWLVVLSDQLPIVDLVGYYPANYLMGRRPISQRPFGPLIRKECSLRISSGISSGFPELSPFAREVVYVILTRSPVYSRYCYLFLPDLHVLGTPPAFVLSQDQTLRCMFFQTTTSRLILSINHPSSRFDPEKRNGLGSPKADLELCTLFSKNT